MDWDKLRIFQAVADAGSFTHAGESRNSASRDLAQIGALEEQLGVMLFHRHARGLILTEQGELLYRTARDMAAKVNTAEALLRANQDKPAGRLKIHATVGFGSTWLTAQMHEFITTYPDIDVSLVVGTTSSISVCAGPKGHPHERRASLGHVRGTCYGEQSTPPKLNQKYGKTKSVDGSTSTADIFARMRARRADVNWLLREGNPDQATRLVVLRVKEHLRIDAPRAGRGMLRCLTNWP